MNEKTMKAGDSKDKSEKEKFEEVKKIAWSACNFFRRSMDAANYKDFILHMLFFKYISDVFEEDMSKMPAQAKGKPKRENAYRKKLEFNIPDEVTFNAICSQRHDQTNIGGMIDNAFDTIAETNEKKLKAVFQGFKFNNPMLLGEVEHSDATLNSLLEKFSQLDLRPSQIKGDIIGEVYMLLIEKFASEAGKKAGEFYTPSQVSRLLARLADPKKGDKVCDPACGSGGLLLEAAKITKDNTKAKLYGMEVNSSTWALCKMNMFVHKHSGENIHKCDSLLNPALSNANKLQHFDIVVANPPFSLKNWGKDKMENDPFGRFSRGVPPDKAADWAFITHMIESAKPKKGRVAVITPHGVLFRGAAEGRIRQAFIEENLLDAVIGLPSNLFQTTSIPVVILIFDRQREEGGAKASSKEVLFIDASQEYESGRNQNSLKHEHLNKILGTYKARKKIKKYSRKVPLSEIAENNYNLNISRYIDTFPEEEKVNIKQVQKEIQQLEKELAKVQKEMKKHLEKIL